MSWLADKLERLLIPQPKPMGFGAAARVVKEPAILLLALVANSGKHLPQAPPGADALVLTGKGPKRPKGESSKNSLPWGVALEAVDLKAVKALEETGCDFIFCAETGTAAALLHEELAKVLHLDPARPDSHLRAISNLPIDALFVENPSQGELDLEALIRCQRLSMLTQRPILLRVTHPLTEGDIEALWNIGVRAFVVNPETAPEGLWEGLRQGINAFVPTPKKEKERLHVSLPPPAGLSPPLEVEEEGEEEEDWDPLP